MFANFACFILSISHSENFDFEIHVAKVIFNLSNRNHSLFHMYI